MTGFHDVKCLHTCTITAKPAGEKCPTTVFWSANDRWNRKGLRVEADDDIKVNDEPLKLEGVNKPKRITSIDFTKPDNDKSRMAFQLADGTNVAVEL